MSPKKIIRAIALLSILLCTMSIQSTTFALTPKSEKGVKVLKAPSLVYESPDWFTPFSLDEAPQDLNYWLGILPYPEDRAEEMYVVMPTLGLITPVVFVPEGSTDFTTMAAGKQIDINKYLVEWVMHYPTSWTPGQNGNPVIFGHSNFYLNGAGKYKTIFADIMNLDVGPYDEVWIYKKDPNGEYSVTSSTWAWSADGTWTWMWAITNTYKLLRFAIEQSYETTPTDVEILLPLGGKELTVFACTNGLEWRWIVRSRYIEDDEVLIPYAMKQRLYEDIKLLKTKSPERQKEITLIVLTKIDEILATVPEKNTGYHAKFKKYVLQWMQRELVKTY